MTIDGVKTIGIVGAGQMGSGIALVAAASGWEILLQDVSEDRLQAAMEKIREGLDRAVEKGLFSAERINPTLARLHPIHRLSDLVEAQLIIEAAPEDVGLKTDLFRQLGLLCRPETILASNTSSISITRLGTVSGRPDRVVGIHFMNPVPAMRLVEVIPGLATSEETVAVALELAKRMGKTAVVCGDSPGFIVNRVLMPMINEAIFLLQEGRGQHGRLTPEAIDLAMTAGANHPMGPLALADRIGLDTVLAICEVLYQDLGDPKFRPCPLLRQYVAAGWLGRKTGRGFYVYNQSSAERGAGS